MKITTMPMRLCVLLQRCSVRVAWTPKLTIRDTPLRLTGRGVAAAPRPERREPVPEQGGDASPGQPGLGANPAADTIASAETTGGFTPVNGARRSDRFHGKPAQRLPSEPGHRLLIHCSKRLVRQCCRSEQTWSDQRPEEPRRCAIRPNQGDTERGAAVLKQSTVLAKSITIRL
jgi:hypothetical protein